MAKKRDPNFTLAEHDRARRAVLALAEMNVPVGLETPFEQMVLEDWLCERTGYVRKTAREHLDEFRIWFNVALMQAADNAHGLEALALRIIRETAGLPGIVSVSVYEATDLVGSEGRGKWINVYSFQSWFRPNEGVFPQMTLRNWGQPSWEWDRTHIEGAKPRGSIWATIQFRSDSPVASLPGWEPYVDSKSLSEGARPKPAPKGQPTSGLTLERSFTTGDEPAIEGRPGLKGLGAQSDRDAMDIYADFYDEAGDPVTTARLRQWPPPERQLQPPMWMAWKAAKDQIALPVELVFPGQRYAAQMVLGHASDVGDGFSVFVNGDYWGYIDERDASDVSRTGRLAVETLIKFWRQRSNLPPVRELIMDVDTQQRLAAWLIHRGWMR